MKAIILFIKGLIIGIGKVIPGVSGAVLAIILNVYDEGIDRIVNLFSDFRKNIFFLLNVGLGIFLGIVYFSNIVNYALNYYYVITMLFFVGLIVGGIPSILKEVDKRDYKYTLIIIVLFTTLSLLNINNNYVFKNNFIDYIIFFLGGIIETCGTIIPGLSSTAMLLILGIYNNVIVSISNVSSLIIDYKVLVPFVLGIISSLFFVSKGISVALKKYKNITYCIILGFIISSIILLIFKTFIYQVKFMELFIGIIFMIIGIIISSILG